jgi:hypothetical protein
MGRIQTGKTAETDYFASQSVNSSEIGRMVAAARSILRHADAALRTFVERIAAFYCSFMERIAAS